MTPGFHTETERSAAAVDLELLVSIQKKVLWLSTYMVHHANHVRPPLDSIKVGGHQSSCASVVSLLTAYYFAAARRGDLISIKPHASPVYHAIQYLLGRLPKEKLAEFRSFGGIQAYPSRTKDCDDVHFSTGSVGLGAVLPNFSALVRRYLADHFQYSEPHRFLALIGDAELDEGNVWEALGEDSLQHLGNVIWMVDLNRQSLDRVVPNGRVRKIEDMLRAFGCHIIEVKYGSQLEAVFAREGGDRLRDRIDNMPNDEYQSLLRVTDPEILRDRLCRPSGQVDPGLKSLLQDYPAAQMRSLIADLGGHDLGRILQAFDEADRVIDRPVMMIAYTVKGWGLPLAGDPMNHSRLLTPEQIEALREELGIEAGEEFGAFAAGSREALCASRQGLRLTPDRRRPRSAVPPIPQSLELKYPREISTQQAFGNVLTELSRRPEVSARIVTTCPDVSISTNLGGWIQKAGVYCLEERFDFFRENAVTLLLNWKQHSQGQHIELGISENNLFLMLAALGLSGDLFGEPLIPIGTIYDTFISRGLDALNYALYNGARFIFAGTPSGISLSGEGGAHQSIVPPSLGVEMPGLAYYEPCYAQEMEWILLDYVRRLQDPAAAERESLYLRLTTVPVQQTLLDPALRGQVLAGGYRALDYRSAAKGYRPGQNVVNVFTCGVMLPVALAASQELADEELYLNVINVTSPGKLHGQWVRALRAQAAGKAAVNAGFHLEQLIPPQERTCPIITMVDGHPHALSFLGSVFGAKTTPLGVDQFGQSGSRQQLYAYHHIDAAAVVRAAIAAVAQ